MHSGVQTIKKLIVLTFIFACNHKETGQQKAEAAVKKYIKQNAHDASSYKSLGFGKLDSIYTTNNDSYEELDVLRKDIVLRYNAEKNIGHKARADSLKEELIKINVQMDASKIFAGLKIYHISQGKNETGEAVMNRGSFYLDSNFVVKEFVMSEDSLLKYDEIKLE